MSLYYNLINVNNEMGRQFDTLFAYPDECCGRQWAVFPGGVLKEVKPEHNGVLKEVKPEHNGVLKEVKSEHDE